MFYNRYTIPKYNYLCRLEVISCGLINVILFSISEIYLQPWVATSASSVGDLATGPGNAPLEEAVVVGWEAVAEVVLPRIEVSSLFPRLFQTSVTAVVSLATLPRIVIFRRMPAITAVEVATSPRTAKSPRESGSSVATTAANRATWPVTVTTLMSRSAIRVENLDTFRKIAPRWSAIGVVKLAM